MSSTELLRELESKIGTGQAREAGDFLRASEAILGESDSDEAVKAAEVGVTLCQTLYGQARSLDALPIALSVFQRATALSDKGLMHRAAVACGLLSSDTADFAGAIEFHGKALEIMNTSGDAAGAGRSWNNIGSALCGVGRYELASASFRRALAQFEPSNRPQFGRYCALTNLAQCAMHAGEIDKGLEAAEFALVEQELGRASFSVDPFTELLLRRNMVRLLVARGDLDLAEQHVHAAKLLSTKDGSVRASIAVATSQAVVDIARGQFDIAATRLDKCLVASRPIRPALRDTLACMVRADEAVGNSARALVRLQELSNLMHDSGAEAAKAHIALSVWRKSIPVFDDSPDLSAAQARLARKRGPASIPSSWSTLTRLALGNALQIEPSAAHGTRVGALSRLLAQACGLGPLQALEIGLAAQIHDVGIAADQENLLGHFSNPSDGPAAEEDLSHCDAGWRILCDDNHPRILIAREIAKYHHASVDGGGHPGGLVGRSIPLHARICAVADAYDNLMHGGFPSRPDTIAQGLRRLRLLSGSRLDAELVEMFSETLEDETRNEGIELDSGHGLTSFHQLINSLGRMQRQI